MYNHFYERDKMMEKIQKVWEKILVELEEIYDDSTYLELFEPLKNIHSIENGLVYFVVSSEFIKGRINSLYSQKLNELISRYYKDESLRLKFITKDEIVSPKQPIYNQNIFDSTYRPGNIRGSNSFENFVVGESNNFAFRTAMTVADQLGMIGNPLYIFGDVGLGKTHLMQAIGNYVLDKDVTKKILYVQASTFIDDFSQVLRNEKERDNYNNKYRDIDVLLIDDIQILGSKQVFQSAFFTIIDLLFSKNKQIVITSDTPASQLKDFSARLTSRFQQGYSVEVLVPTLEHRIRIIKSKMRTDYRLEQHLDNESVCFIAENFQTNIRELYGALNNVMNYSIINNLPPSLELTKEALDVLLKTRKKTKSASENDYDKIQSVVADYFQITTSDLIGPKRTANLVKARHIAMYLMKQYYRLTYKLIGEMFGNRDHSSVLTAVEKIENEINNDQKLKNAIETIVKKLKLSTN